MTDDRYDQAGGTGGMRLVLEMQEDRYDEFYPLLQAGFSLTIRTGGTLQRLMEGQWGLSPEYAAQRITTLFLNSRAIDAPEKARVDDGATIALSGAMPGLVGATMRRGGYYAAMRGAITHRDDSASAHRGGSGTIRVKIFNILLPELGPEFLRRGIGLTAAETADFFRNRGERFWAGCRSARLNGRPAVRERLGDEAAYGGSETVTLTVTFRE